MTARTGSGAEEPEEEEEETCEGLSGSSASIVSSLGRNLLGLFHVGLSSFSCLFLPSKAVAVSDIFSFLFFCERLLLVSCVSPATFQRKKLSAQRTELTPFVSFLFLDHEQKDHAKNDKEKEVLSLNKKRGEEWGVAWHSRGRRRKERQCGD